MKYFTFLLFLVLSCLTATGLTAQANKPWTMMVYLNGSDLETGSNAGTTDLAEMTAVSATSNVNIIVLTGGAAKPGWNTIKCYRIENGVQTELTYNANVGNDMANPANLTNFINWTVTNYPADKYFLDMWNHGGDIQGYGWDENTGGHLTVPQFKNAIAATNLIQNGQRFELIGFDACLMATLEVANALVPYGEYMVASEEQEPGHGWDYTPILQSLQNGGGANGAEIATTVVDGFYAQGIATGNHGLTLSVIDLTFIGSLVEKVGNGTDQN